MGRRPEPDKPLNREELSALEKRFASMGSSELVSFYHAAYRRSQLVYQLPTASALQELVAVWKHMRKRKKIR